MKILNLYAGIGGNRKLWGDEHEVTAVEIDPIIAKIYQDFFPDDKMIVGDAHQYLLDHFQEFDFIWSSPPCPTHSRIQFSPVSRLGGKLRYPDMQLYQEIILLQTFHKGKYVVENVISYYDPLITPQKLGRHYFWSNSFLPRWFGKSSKVRHDKGETLEFLMKAREIIVKDFHGYKKDKRQLLTNCVEPDLGLHIFNAANSASTTMTNPSITVYLATPGKIYGYY